MGNESILTIKDCINRYIYTSQLGTVNKCVRLGVPFVFDKNDIDGRSF
jgi:hypothetical protein